MKLIGNAGTPTKALLASVIAISLACVAAIAAASPERPAAAIVRVIPLKIGTHAYRFRVRHSTANQPPLILYSQRPKTAKCRVSDYGYRAVDKTGIFHAQLRCRGVRRGARAAFRFRKPLVRSFALANKVGKLDIRLDKPAGRIAPLLLLKTSPPQPGKCQARRSRLTISTHLFHLHIVAECRGLADGTRGVLIVGGLVLGDGSVPQPSTAFGTAGVSAGTRPTSAGSNCTPLSFGFRECVLTLDGFWDSLIFSMDSACPGQHGELVDWPPKIPDGVASIRLSNSGDGWFTNWMFDRKEIKFDVQCS